MSTTNASVFRVQSWRTTLLAASVVLLIVMALLMKWLVELQVETAQERQLREAVAREADARCYALPTRREVDVCRAANAVGMTP
ncbi:general secretion pathway protein GspL [Variovorax sp. RO1]|uniref:general secretion pathway protein GspL n=1 Tax=Variovorax sp. RO1 TaxID=2066034 RepID=UPI000C71816D|nr:general secretion pathway protein GspL [Variovorax sp. RO1]PLC03280.1 general secretion pathway protein GspL [Variovorax sp. RO1]